MKQKNKVIRFLIILAVLGVVGVIVYYLILKPLGIQMPAVTRKARWRRAYIIHAYANWAANDPWTGLMQGILKILEAEGREGEIVGRPAIDDWIGTETLAKAAIVNATSAYDFGELADQPSYQEQFNDWWERKAPKGGPPTIDYKLIGTAL